MAKPGSFAQRIASMASTTTIENWDDDGDFQGDIFGQSMSTTHSFSSRQSARSESNTGDDDWQLLLAPNDELSTRNAISSAKQAGIPIPTSVPSSALLGGSIKRLGKKKSHRKIDVDDDWGNDLELPSAAGALKLKVPQTPADNNNHDDDFDWGEGSLGIRFAGTRRDGRGGRSSSVSAMSPSMGSCMTLESEDDDLTGLVLPTEPLDFKARLEKHSKADLPTPDASPLPALHVQKREPAPTSAPKPAAPLPVHAQTPTPHLAPSLLPPLPITPPIESEPEQAPKPKPAEDEEDFLDGLDFGAGEALDTKKLKLNRNVVVKKAAGKAPVPAAARAATTITFTDKQPASRIPKPPTSSRSRLAPVFESGAPGLGNNRPMPTTTSAQLLRAKRSAPLLRHTNNNYAPPQRPTVPFLPAGGTGSQSHHVKSKNSQPHLRRDSDPRRPHSPAMRSHSRMSSINAPDTPSRTSSRREGPTAAPVRSSGLTRSLHTRQLSKKNFGDGSELEGFDDLPTSASKEKDFVKVPKNMPSNKSLRHLPSNSKLPMPDRTATTTPVPHTPRSPVKVDSTPRFARDTAASRIAREQRLAGTRSRGEGPIAPTATNWKAQVAARSPHASPTAQRKRGNGQKPMLIKAMSAPMAKNEKGMTYNPSLQRWEGNEDALISFSHPNTSTTTLALTTASTPTFAPPNRNFPTHDRSHSISHIALSSIQANQKSFASRAARAAPVPSPPRPALIAQINQPKGQLIDRGMLFDPAKMTWIKAPRVSTGDHRSPSPDQDEEEDPFSGIEDLKDNTDAVSVAGAAGAPGAASNAEEGTFVGEEFDLGPSFIRRQRDEETNWRKRTEGWVGPMRDTGHNRNGWRWQIRNIAASYTEELRRG